jgi:hypothetical protein
MKRRRVLQALAAGGAVLALAGCGRAGRADLTHYYTPYRYRLIATVETPEGVRTGSSVIEVKWAAHNYKVRGEAAAVDLPGGQTLFVLLRSAVNPDWAAYAFESTGVFSTGRAPLAASEEDFWRGIAADRGTYPVNRRRVTAIEDSDNYPYMVRFRDPADPKSVEQVDPDNLAKTFGPGYRLKSLSIQMTGDPVTSGIEKRLPSFGAGSDFDEWYRSLPYGDPRRITLDDFHKGDAR